jgi:IS30 family transposase
MDQNTQHTLTKRKIWTESQLQILQSLLAKKKDVTTIAKNLGKSEKAIRRKCERLNISCSPLYKKAAQKQPRHS